MPFCDYRPAALAAVLAVTLANAAPLHAQEAAQPAEEAFASASPDDLPPVEDSVLGNAITIDPADISPGGKAAQFPASSSSTNPNWSRSDRPDGSASIGVNRPLSGWDAKVGADFALPPAPVTAYGLSKPLPGTISKDPGSSSAWANVDVPDVATLELRAQPSPNQGKVGTQLQRSVPISSNLSVTLQNNLSVTENFTGASASSATAAVATASIPNAAMPSRVWGSEQTVKFNVLSTGTTFAAATSRATNDPLLHNKFSAQQQIYGPLNVTTSVTDLGQATSAKSITAGVKLNW